MVSALGTASPILSSIFGGKSKTKVPTLSSLLGDITKSKDTADSIGKVADIVTSLIGSNSESSSPISSLFGGKSKFSYNTVMQDQFTSALTYSLADKIKQSAANGETLKAAKKNLSQYNVSSVISAYQKAINASNSTTPFSSTVG